MLVSLGPASRCTRTPVYPHRGLSALEHVELVKYHQLPTEYDRLPLMMQTR
jgi:hypothetical protein